MKTCTVDGCEKPVKKGRTICCMHDNRWYRSKNMHETKILPRFSTAEDIINRYFSSEKTDRGCIEVSCSKSKLGYGRVSFNGKTMFAHRFSYEFYCGPIPDGMIICHKCDNPGCVNPDHLFLGTHNDNVQDKILKGRAVILKGSKCGRAKLNEEEVLSIRKDPRRYKEIAVSYGVSLVTIKEIRARKTWRHI